MRFQPLDCLEKDNCISPGWTADELELVAQRVELSDMGPLTSRNGYNSPVTRFPDGSRNRGGMNGEVGCVYEEEHDDANSQNQTETKKDANSTSAHNKEELLCPSPRLSSSAVNRQRALRMRSEWDRQGFQNRP